jgi:hypothetical protein
MHEVGHGIFESAFVGASLDFLNRRETGDPLELRAQAFALECLVPKEVLVHAAHARGIKWANLSARSLAAIVADTHVEQRAIVAAALDASLILPEVADELLRMDIGQDLREFSSHALSTEEYLELIGAQDAEKWIGKRTTTLTPRPLRLPVGYVTAVVEANRNRHISLGKAAEYLMIDKTDYEERFGDIYEGAEA